MTATDKLTKRDMEELEKLVRDEAAKAAKAATGRELTRLAEAIEKLASVLANPSVLVSGPTDGGKASQRPPADPKDVSVDDVRSALRGKAGRDGKAAAKAVLKKFKAETVSDLKPSQYVAVAAACA